MQNLAEILSRNSYPGRGIVAGLTPDGSTALLAYFIMGRSQNSRNRVFAATEGGIQTMAADDTKLQDPSLIIYHPVRRLGNTHIVTNGDQTDTVLAFLQTGDPDAFANALRTRCFEPDAPNWTPRISAAATLQKGEFAYKMAILKSADASGTACQRFFYEYQPIAGQGHLLHTYLQDGTPIPSFAGEPTCVAMPKTAAQLAEQLWQNLNQANKVSLFVRSISLADGAVSDKIINKYNRV